MIRIDFTDTGARIKPLHGIGQPPTRGNDCGMFHYLTEAGIPFSRLHDVGGYFGGGRFVDIPNLFPDPDADPADPASYRFGFTDLLVTELMKSGTEPFFRLGVTIENEWAVYAARIWPPRDSLAWAKICEGVIRHYTEGWADGFHYPIRYWEIWNEPDNVPDPMENPMWRGSAEQFFELYATASTYLKEKFPHLKIGGYGSCGFYGVTGGNVPTYAATSPRFDYFRTFFDDFLAYVKAHNCPLDFFSWHSYDSVPSTGMFAAYARHRLDAEGFTETETTCDEWNCRPPLRGARMHAARGEYVQQPVQPADRGAVSGILCVPCIQCPVSAWTGGRSVYGADGGSRAGGCRPACACRTRREGRRGAWRGADLQPDGYVPAPGA